jgi:5-methylcytosine-specific restriction endonuclease McrA
MKCECVCLHCNKTYLPKKPDRNKYCSRECAYKDKAAKHRGITPVFVFICPRCGVHTKRGNECVKCQKIQARVWASIGDICSVGVKDECKCKECGKLFTPEYADKRRDYCSGVCSRKHGRRIGKAVRRARIRNAPQIDSIDPIAVFERDKWRCHLCGGRTSRGDRGTILDNAPELDHIIPLSVGGTHTYDNVACACRRCNNGKGSWIVGQQRLPLGLR